MSNLIWAIPALLVFYLTWRLLCKIGWGGSFLIASIILAGLLYPVIT